MKPPHGGFFFCQAAVNNLYKGLKNSSLGGSLLKMLFQFSEAYGVKKVGEWKLFLAEFTTLQKMFCNLQINVDSEK